MSLEREVWTLGERLGRGWFGDVLEAWTESGELGAAKLVFKEPGAERELLFAHLTGVRHVIPVIDRGETDTHLVMVMVRAEKSLRQHLDEHVGALDSGAATAILSDVAETLTDLAACDGGPVIHRDLKPENILLLDGRWCTSDFGIARYAESATDSNTRSHAKSSAYTAPERWRDEKVTTATDVYSFGVMAYELLTGERPFRGETPELRDQHLHSMPPLLSDASPQLAGLIDMCLAKPSASRPRSADLPGRLRRTEVVPRLAGVAALQVAGQAEARRRAQEAATLSLARTRREKREELAVAAARSLTWIVDGMKTMASAEAPAADVRDANGLRVGVGKALLSLNWLSRVDNPWEDWDGVPFDVVACTEISVEMPANRLGYEGRSHSLWYCDVEQAGRFQWYETGFMAFSLNETASVTPFSMRPSREIGMALSGVSGRWRHAWPFLPVVPGDMDDFVDRWAGTLAQAADRTLRVPSLLPERPVEGSWRKV
ncbi:serine/threonine protein kinase [Lentzea sp. NBC_00516]|uniref:serine/threonine-protein kinase n=1 Tax=Lentzea sp. NBC_00516 TaxID=2903582 RepID=UPI002E8177FF|nr:serine/threonine-protein kinase [Lentzea sp. NBC_00516]WUD26463.1 serine/threonine protein kinase [Lentzea sp. NBC_00516]